MTKPARVLAVALVALFAAWTGVTATPAAAATSTAVVVIDSPQGQRSSVIHFDGTITGIQALQLAGGDPLIEGYSGVGGAVCTIDGYGNDPSTGANCLVGPNSQYWGYFRARNGATGWSYSNVGAGASAVGDGDVEGWRYGVGQMPRLSASFCSYVTCAPAPTDPPPTPVTGPPAAPSGAGSTGAPAPAFTTDPGATATTAPSTTGPGGKSKGGDTAAAGKDEPTAGSSPAPEKTGEVTAADGRSVSTRRSDDDGKDREAALASTGSEDGGSGSPIGVAIVAGILAAVAVTTVLVRRSRSSASG